MTKLILLSTAQYLLASVAPSSSGAVYGWRVYSATGKLVLSRTAAPSPQPFNKDDYLGMQLVVTLEDGSELALLLDEANAGVDTEAYIDYPLDTGATILSVYADVEPPTGTDQPWAIILNVKSDEWETGVVRDGYLLDGPDYNNVWEYD